MSPEEFAFKWKHEWRGLLLDTAMKEMSGGQRSLYLRQLEQKIDNNLKQMYADAQPKPNGAPKK